MTTYIVPIEPIDSRYTKQWYARIPSDLRKMGVDCVTIDGDVEIEKPTAGAFLDFYRTNQYKSQQIEKIASLFQNRQIRNGDSFLITDAWNYAAIAIRYMSELTGIKIKMHGIWHAGSYDPTDILGSKVNKKWSYDFERSLFHAYDYNYFATEFHRTVFLRNLFSGSGLYNDKAIISGQPHGEIIDAVDKINENNFRERLDIAVWPHRYNDDKQPHIAENVDKFLLDMGESTAAQVYFTQKASSMLSKQKYYGIMSQCKVVLSCALHENLGISVMEGVLLGCIPIVPDRSSYREMYFDEFRYPEHYFKDNKLLANLVLDRINNYHKFNDLLIKQQHVLKYHYMVADKMYNTMVTA